MRFCKYCGTQIEDDMNICQDCEKKLEEQTKLNSKSDKTHFFDFLNSFKNLKIVSVTIAIVCIAAIAIVLIAANSGKCEYSGCTNKAISGMSYCYSHKCAVPDCDEKAFVLSKYCYNHYLLYDDDASVTPVYSYELKISNVELSSSGGYTVAKGKITNNGDATVSFVKIKGSFENYSGTVVDTDWTYAVGAEGLAPGESCTWRMSVTRDNSIKECSVSILDFDY